MFGLQKEIEVCIGDKDGEITDIYIRFALPTSVLPQLSEWANFAGDLCGRFHLRLGANGASPCDEDEFLTAVRGHRNYREFAARFGWEASR